MTEDELALTLGGISDGLTAVGDQLAKATEEIIAALHAQTGTTSPAVDAAVNKLTTIGAALKAAAQTLDDLNPDAAPAPAPAPTSPPADDAFVAVGDIRFSDGAIQTEETKAAAVAVWNAAHPDGPVAS